MIRIARMRRIMVFAVVALIACKSNKGSKLRDAGTTVLLVTHELDEAEALCERVVAMRDGRVMDQGTPAELVEPMRQARALGVQHMGVRLRSRSCNEMVDQIDAFERELLPALATRRTRLSSVPIAHFEPGAAFSTALMMNSVEPTRSALSTTSC